MSEELYQTILALRPVGPVSNSAGKLVFTNGGKPIRFFYDAWKRAAKRAGLPGLLLHDCRRSAVRNLKRARVSDKGAMTISGHKTRSVFDRYNIVDEKDLRDATIKLEHHLKKSSGTAWAQNQHLQPQGDESGKKGPDVGKAVSH